MKKVVFLGLGYIGLPTAAVAAAHGFEVIGVDVNPSVVETINQGKIHIVEPELGQVVRDVVQSGKLRAVCTVSYTHLDSQCPRCLHCGREWQILSFRGI